MADNKKHSVMDMGLSFLRQIIGTGEKAPEVQPEAKKVKLEDIGLDDLNRERIRLENEERKKIDELSDIENQKRKLFEAGVKNTSVHEQKAIARRMLDLEGRAKNLDSMLSAISKQMRIVSGLIQIKERTQLMSQMGLSGVLQNIDLQNLVGYINESSVDGKFNVEKFDNILRALGQADSLVPQMDEEPGVDKLVALMQKAHDAGEVQDAYSQADRTIKEVKGDAGKEDPEKDY